jgi:hypothetical protein
VNTPASIGVPGHANYTAVPGSTLIGDTLHWWFRATMHFVATYQVRFGVAYRPWT